MQYDPPIAQADTATPGLKQEPTARTASSSKKEAVKKQTGSSLKQRFKTKGKRKGHSKFEFKRGFLIEKSRSSTLRINAPVLRLI